MAVLKKLGVTGSRKVYRPSFYLSAGILFLALIVAFIVVDASRFSFLIVLLALVSAAMFVCFAYSRRIHK